MKFIRTLFACLLTLVPFSAKAQTRDVFVSQNGGGTGQSCISPTTVGSLNWSTIGAGSTVHLCGPFTAPANGTVLTVQSNGAAGNPLTIKFENAVLSSPNFSSFGAINISHKSYITIDGNNQGVIQNTAYGSAFPYVGSSRGVLAEICTNCTVENLVIQNIYVRNTPTDLRPTQQQLNCVEFNGASGMTIHNVTCHDAGWALAGHGNNLTIEYSNLYNIDHGLAFGAGGTEGNFSIHDNHIHDYVNWDSPTNFAHHDGIHIWGQQGGTVNGGVIYRNLIDGDSGVNITAHIYLQDSIQNVTVRDNIIVTLPTRTINALWFAARSLTVANGMPGGLAMNNSAINNFIRNQNHGHSSGAALTAQSQVNFTSMYNTLLGGTYDFSILGPNPTINHNIYEDLLADAGSLNSFAWQGTSYHTLAGWRTACNCDADAVFVPAAQITITAPASIATEVPNGQGIRDGALGVSKRRSANSTPHP